MAVPLLLHLTFQLSYLHWNTFTMPVTEVALLHLKCKDPSALTKEGLKQAMEKQSRFSKHPVNILFQIQDPRYFYLIGGWESITVHCNEWIPSDTNQTILRMIKDEVDIEWVFHIDTDVRSPLIC